MGSARAKSGDSVKVHYVGKLEDGSEFASSQGGEPLEFTLGQGEYLPGFEEAVVGMKEGEQKSAKVVSDKAYGPHMEELVAVVDRDKFASEEEPEVGEFYEIPQPEGEDLGVVVTEISDAGVTIDANHPLAGKDLIFDIQLLEILL